MLSRARATCLATCSALLPTYSTATRRWCAAGGTLRHLASHSTWSSIATASAWLLGLGAVLKVISGATYVMDALPLFRAGDDITEEPRRVAAGGDR